MPLVKLSLKELAHVKRCLDKYGNHLETPKRSAWGRLKGLPIKRIAFNSKVIRKLDKYLT